MHLSRSRASIFLIFMRQIFSWLSGASPAHCAGKEALESSDAEQQGGGAAESSSEAADESSSQSTSESSSPPSSSTFAPDEEEKATAWAGAALPSRATRPRWLPQPGPFDSFMMDSMGVMMFPTFDGFELAMTNQIGASATNMFRVVHTVKLGNSQCENGVDYTFAPQVMFGDQTDRNASQTWLVGNTDLGNVVSGRVIHAAGANELSLDLQLTHRNSHNMLKWSHTGEDHSFGLKFGGSPETTTYLGGDYCQSITKNWSLGRECATWAAHCALSPSSSSSSLLTSFSPLPPRRLAVLRQCAGQGDGKVRCAAQDEG